MNSNHFKINEKWDPQFYKIYAINQSLIKQIKQTRNTMENSFKSGIFTHNLNYNPV